MSFHMVRGARTVLTDLASVSGARFGAVVLSALSVTLTTRIVTPAGYGVIAYVATLSNLMFAVTSSWTATAAVRYGREELEARGKLTGTAWNRLVFTAPLILVAVVAVIVLKAMHALPSELSWPFVGLAVASGIALVASEAITSLLEAQGRMKLTALGLIARQAVVVAVLLAIRISGHWRSPLAVLILSVVAVSSVAVVLTRVLWKVGFWPPHFDRQLGRRMVTFSIPMIAFTAGQYVIRSVDIVLLRAFTTATTTGIYAVAYQGYSVLQGVANTATVVLTPLFVSLGAANKEAIIERYLRRAVPQLVFLTAAMCGIGIAVLRLFVPVVFGAAFRRAGEPFAILLLALSFYTSASFLAPILLLHERSRATGAVNVLAALVNVVGDVVLLGVFHMGIVGPAIATSCALAVIAGGYYFTARACTGTRPAVDPLLLLPLPVALVPVLILSPGVGTLIALPATVVCSLILLRWHSPFATEDADIIDKLNMPLGIKRIAHRAINLAAR